MTFDPNSAEPEYQPAEIADLPYPDEFTERPPSHLRYWLLLGVGLVVYISLFVMGGDFQRFALSGLEPLPFLILAILAYLGDRYRELRILAFVYWLLLMTLVGMLVIMMAFVAVIKPELIDQIQAGSRPTNLGAFFYPGGTTHLAVVSLLSLVVGLLGMCVYLPAIRRTAAGLLPTHADSFVHTVALATVLTTIGLMVLPLAVMGQPPLLEILVHFRQHSEDLKQAGGGSATSDIVDQLGSLDQNFDYLALLIWQVPCAVLAVGYPFVRTIRESLVRIGLVWPSAIQIAFGFLSGLALVVVMLGVDFVIQQVWSIMGWNTTNEREFNKLMQSAINPLGALIIGVVAGLGEELFTRGVLQPRLGIVLSNLFFTSLHALQYNWDGLLSVFLIGLVLGVIRKQTNTTTSAIVHGTFDFTLIMLAYWGMQ